MLAQYGSEFALIAVAHLLAVISPGPDFLMTVRQSVRFGFRTGSITAVGIGTGILVHVFYTVLGIAILLRDNPQLFQLVRYAGAAYLLWLGWKCLHSGAMATMDVSGNGGDMPSSLQAFRTGFLTNALNPKATLFFLALFTSIVSRSTPWPVQLAYGLWMLVVTALWFVLVAWVMVRPPVRAMFLRAGVWFDRILGVLLWLLAARLIWH
ncbi:LysE family translocator [Permianibacter sp. IMCC34836]|uniref:LysE family translocator n=1 Tax=Permianibacter fluminis TaxID=2738515 RepID=UPI001552707C|nr:LysE family translocator [Permianibacter fluminis]NQD38185.1 LysE family translocator [Permianibacter fluminis]